MFTKEEVSRTKQEFWIAFGRYIGPVPSSEGVKVSWLNYHTGIRDVYLPDGSRREVGDHFYFHRACGSGDQGIIF
ncbi:MAG: hypothetical protein WDN75_04500 [Bacteroidota bacterium]